MNRKLIFTRVAAVVLVLVLVAGGWAAVQVWNTLHGRRNGDTPRGAASIGEVVHSVEQITGDPYQGFPGQDKIVILGMGIDDNWTNGDEVYTAGARTDTLFFLTLYLKEKRATMLSIPRDTYTHIAGTSYSTKINAAYASGGPQRAIATVAEMTGVHADHYMVLNIDATKKMVDALGGVDVDVQHEMHYHDKWGHLSIDLYPGEQHMDGDKAVAFVRYRHPDAGGKPSPEDGDERRMARQHVLLRAMVTKAKSFFNVADIGHLADIGMGQIHTDLTRTQLLDLAAIYRNIQPETIQTASLPGVDFHSPGGSWDYRLFPDKMKDYVAWLVLGNDSAARSLVPVVIRNQTSVAGLAAHAADLLRAQGYSDVRVIAGRSRSNLHLASQGTVPDAQATIILDTGVPDTGADADVKTILNIPNAVDSRVPNKPNRLGWTAPSTLTISLGDDFGRRLQSGGGVAAVDASAAPPVSNQ